jgi:hypothetical protein
MTNLRTRGLIFFEQRGGVLHADPDPAAKMSLIALAEKDRALAACHIGEIRKLPVQTKSELLDVIVNAGVDVPSNPTAGRVAWDELNRILLSAEPSCLKRRYSRNSGNTSR